MDPWIHKYPCFPRHAPKLQIFLSSTYKSQVISATPLRLNPFGCWLVLGWLLAPTAENTTTNIDTTTTTNTTKTIIKHKIDKNYSTNTKFVTTTTTITRPPFPPILTITPTTTTIQPIQLLSPSPEVLYLDV